jgi:hypothetical protein
MCFISTETSEAYRVAERVTARHGPERGAKVRAYLIRRIRRAGAARQRAIAEARERQLAAVVAAHEFQAGPPWPEPVHVQ